MGSVGEGCVCVCVCDTHRVKSAVSHSIACDKACVTDPPSISEIFLVLSLPEPIPLILTESLSDCPVSSLYFMH